MSARQAIWFLAAYAAIVAVGIWFDLAVLCQGDLKYSHGCGGFGLYIPLWEVFLAPLPVAAIGLEWRRRSGTVPTSRLLGYLAIVLVVCQLGFVFIHKFPILLATETLVIMLGTLLRLRERRRLTATH